LENDGAPKRHAIVTLTQLDSSTSYGISIPQVRQVASVADQVRLELDFVAVAA
jgi:hypothetical protein